MSQKEVDAASTNLLSKPYQTLSIWNYGPSSPDEKVAHHLIRARSAIDAAQAVSASIQTELRKCQDNSSGPVSRESLRTVKWLAIQRQKSLMSAFVDVRKLRSLVRGGQAGLDSTRALPARATHIPTIFPPDLSEEAGKEEVSHDSRSANETSASTLERNKNMQERIRDLDVSLHSLFSLNDTADSTSSIPEWDAEVERARQSVITSLQSAQDALSLLSRPAWISEGNWVRWRRIWDGVTSVRSGAAGEWAQFADGALKSRSSQ